MQWLRFLGAELDQGRHNRAVPEESDIRSVVQIQQAQMLIKVDMGRTAHAGVSDIDSPTANRSATNA